MIRSADINAGAVMGRAAALAAVIVIGMAGASRADDQSMFDGKSAGEFVAYCDAHRDTFKTLRGPCPETIAWVGVILVVKKNSTVCLTGGGSDEQTYIGIVDWLKSRPDLARTDCYEAITTAFQTLYPC